MFLTTARTSGGEPNAPIDTRVRPSEVAAAQPVRSAAAILPERVARGLISPISLQAYFFMKPTWVATPFL
eukprot:664607-Prymnesium_polylepis.1